VEEEELWVELSLPEQFLLHILVQTIEQTLLELEMEHPFLQELHLQGSIITSSLLLEVEVESQQELDDYRK